VPRLARGELGAGGLVTNESPDARSGTAPERAVAAPRVCDSEAARMVLGIETSCDDTSVAVLERGHVLRSHLIAGQDVHKLYGGVVPELASRAHLELLPRLVPRALDEA